jgi:hypothetical protein
LQKEWLMNAGRAVFSQVMDFLPLTEFRRWVERYRGDYKVQSFSCLDQFLCMAFAQLTYRESLRDIETCLRSMPSRLYHMGVRGRVARSTLADANEHRDWRIYADFAQGLIRTARQLYLDDAFGVELEQSVYALDSTTIDLCLTLFPWARFRKHKGAVKLHTLLDLRDSIPAFTGCGKTQFGNGIASNEACEEMTRSSQRCSIISPWRGGFLRTTLYGGFGG